eukprot:Filipodium_phascolosomae@DN716_c0_g1_i1.p1
MTIRTSPQTSSVTLSRKRERLQAKEEDRFSKFLRKEWARLDREVSGLIEEDRKELGSVTSPRVVVEVDRSSKGSSGGSNDNNGIEVDGGSEGNHNSSDIDLGMRKDSKMMEFPIKANMQKEGEEVSRVSMKPTLQEAQLVEVAPLLGDQVLSDPETLLWSKLRTRGQTQGGGFWTEAKRSRDKARMSTISRLDIRKNLQDLINRGILEEVA